MKIYFKTRQQARDFAKIKPSRKVATNKAAQGWAVSLQAVKV